MKVIFIISCAFFEYFDFVIYGIFSTYLQKVFFPASDNLLALLNIYLVFVLGYIGRPFGGILLGVIADKYSRKNALLISMSIMGIASFSIAVLPSYASMGILAPILLMVCRLLQGFALGGELPTSITLLSETFPHQRILSMGLLYIFLNLGKVFGDVVHRILLVYFSSEQMFTIGWRIPFLIGGLFSIVCYSIRSQLLDKYQEHKKSNLTFSLRPLLQFKTHLLSCFCISGSFIGLTILNGIYINNFLVDILKYPRDFAVNRILFLNIFIDVSIFLLALYVQKNKNFYFVLIKLIPIACVVMMISYAVLIHISGSYVNFMVFGICESILNIICPVAISTLFVQNIRATGIAIGYNSAAVLLGSLSPTYVTYLIHLTQTPDAIIFYVGFLFMLLQLGIYLSRKTINLQLFQGPAEPYVASVSSVKTPKTQPLS